MNNFWKVTDSSIYGPRSVDTLYQVARDCYGKGKYREAEYSMTRAYANFERLEIKDKAKRLSCLRFLSLIYLRLQEDEKMMQYAFEIAIHALTDDDRAFAYGMLGLAYGNKGEYDKAIEYYEKALAIQLEVHGAEHPDIGTNYNNIGLAYGNKGEYDKAIEYYEKAFAIRLKTLGMEHPAIGQSYKNIAKSYNSLETACLNKGEYDKALGYHEKSLAIRLKALEGAHPDAVKSFNSLGEDYKAKGKHEKAIGFFEHSLAITLKAHGAEHPDVGTCYNNLGAADKAKGNQAYAMAYFLKAKAIYLKKLGAQHPMAKDVQAWIDGLSENAEQGQPPSAQPPSAQPPSAHKLPKQELDERVEILSATAEEEDLGSNTTERWESDIAELQQEDWEDHLGGPDMDYLNDE